MSGPPYRHLIGPGKEPAAPALAAACDPAAASADGPQVVAQPAPLPTDTKAFVAVATELLARLGFEVRAPTAVPAQATEPCLSDAQQVADALGISRFTVYRMAAARLIPCVHIGRKVRFEIDAVVAALRREPQPQERAPSTRALPHRRPAVKSDRERRAASRTTTQPDRPPLTHEDRIRAATGVTRALGK